VKNANPLSGSRLIRLLAIAVLVLSGCGGDHAAAPLSAVPKTIADFFTIKVGDRPVHMQLAVLDAEMEHGLMGRRDLAPDDGMIFIFHAPTQMDFWMHDTPTALDVGYFTPEGDLAEIYPMWPFDERTVASRRSDLQFALEMNQGWYAAHGVRAGAHIDMAALLAALQARGFDPAKFGLKP
jgi:uncharacterized membrane protein (UPF0127 family)